MSYYINDLIIQRQIYNKINNYEVLSKDSVSKIIDYSKNRQLENNNIFKNDKLKYLTLFFNNEKKPFYKINSLSGLIIKKILLWFIFQIIH